jgi:RNA polymerase sigma-70 factor (ECF subfamily)
MNALDDPMHIVPLLKKRDSSSFQFLYDKYVPSLWGCIIKLIPDRDVAAVVLQQSIQSIWQNIPRFDASKSRLLPWMLCFTIKHCREMGACGDGEILQKIITCRKQFEATA